MREAWTDERLDDLNKRMDEGFRRVDEQFNRVDERFRQVDERFRQVDERFDRVEQSIKDLGAEMLVTRSEMNLRLDGIQRAMVHGVVAMTAAVLAGFAGILTLLAAQL